MSNIPQKLKTIKIIHLAIYLGLVCTYIFIGDILSVGKLKFPEVDSSSIIYLLIPVIAIVASNVIYKIQVKKADPHLALEDKIPFYQTAMISRLIVLEAAAFVLLFIAPRFAIFGLLIITYMLFLNPTETKFRRDFDNPNK